MTLCGDSKHVAIPAPRHMGLRQLTAAHLKANRSEFGAFVCDETTGDALDAAGYDAYCTRLASDGDAVLWGGQTELAALVALLDRPIIVHTAKQQQPLTMGAPSKGAVKLAPLRITYHEHYYGLGAHYNSVAPAGK